MKTRILIISLVCVALMMPILAFKVEGQTSRGQGVRIGENKNTQKKVALVIGNSAYTDSPLKNPMNDAKDMAQVLRELGFSVDLQVDATREKMLEAIDNFGDKIEANSVALFYFAGHGVQSSGNNYLIPVNAAINKESELEYKAVNAGFVLAKVEGSKNTLNLMILDACRNNPFARSFRSASGGLAQMNASKGTVIMYATSPGKTASDGNGRNGLYTQELLKAIKTPGLKIEDVFKKVAESVNRLSNDQQLPWIASSFFGEFSFSGGGSSIPAANNSNNTNSANSTTPTTSPNNNSNSTSSSANEEALRIERENAKIKTDFEIVKKHVEDGAALAQRSNYEGAIKEFKAAAIIDDSQPVVYAQLCQALFNLGAVRFNAKQKDQAQALFKESAQYGEKAVKLEPNNANYLKLYADSCHILFKQFQNSNFADKAVNAYTTSFNLEQDPVKKSKMINRIADIYYSQGDMDKCNTTYQKVLAIDPNNTEALKGTANVILAITTGNTSSQDKARLEKAMAIYRQILNKVQGSEKAEVQGYIDYLQVTMKIK